MKWFIQLSISKPLLAFFLKYTLLFFMLFMSIALAAFHSIIAVESNTFFYANF
jgi:hypothetical protein